MTTWDSCLSTALIWGFGYDRGARSKGQEVMTLEAVGVCSGTVLSGSPPRNTPFAKALLAWVPPTEAWGSAAALWPLTGTASLKPELRAYSLQQACGALVDPRPRKTSCSR